MIATVFNNTLINPDPPVNNVVIFICISISSLFHRVAVFSKTVSRKRITVFTFSSDCDSTSKAPKTLS